MKKIECYVHRYDAETVASAMVVEGIKGMNITEGLGFGVQLGFARGEESKEGAYVLLPKAKIEMVVPDADVERIIEAIKRSLKSKQIGEGKIFVTPVEDAVRTRTGERGEIAIT